jgi:small-conductance mechanosensitive channel
MELSEVESWLVALAVVMAAAVLGYAVRLFVIPRLARISSRTATDLDDLLLASIKKHVPYWFVLGGVVLAAHWAPIGDRFDQLARNLCAALFFLSLSFAAAHFVGGLVDRAARGAEGSFATTSLAHNVMRGIVLGIGALLVLVNLGVEITPLLTALGVGSLAVALALQPTLSNLFAGLHISMSKPIRIGDFVELEGGAQGFIADIGWRTTTVRDPANNLLVLPNARVSEMMLKNYSMPVPEQGIGVELGVGYGSDLERVERITCEVAREVLASIPGAVASAEPSVRFHTFADSAIRFTVGLRVQHFSDKALVVHEFLKRLKARFESERIEIPFPQRVMHRSPPLRAPSPEPAPAPKDGSAV